MGALGIYGYKEPEIIDKNRIQEGYVFQIHVGSCSDFSKGNTRENRDTEPRRYRAVKRYRHFMLCESLNGYHRHMRCFDWFSLRKAKIISTR